jgi:L-lactate dehydrogenase (cytochrome)
MKRVACIEDLRSLARRRVPRMFFDFVDSGAYAEATLAANRRDLDALALRQRVLVDVSARDLTTTLMGETLSMPVGLSPTGLTGMVHGNGEVLAARAAAKAGVPYCLSTMSVCSIEHLAAAKVPFWFQLYMMKDRGFVRSLLERAAAAGCSTLVVSVDVPLLGQRHRDVRNGLTVPLRPTLASLLGIASRPAWALGVLAAGRWSFGNFEGRIDKGSGTINEWIGRQFDASTGWKDVEWLRGLWQGKLVLKGILDPDDAALAAKAGADGIVVSNHGGRQLDGALSSVSALPAIADRVGGDLDVMIDSGIRSGQDVLRCLALGAKACLIGRGFLYGLGAGGEAGVTKALDILRRELDVSMALAGLVRPDQVGRDALVAPKGGWAGSAA